jgi:hypothetical protein
VTRLREVIPSTMEGYGLAKELRTIMPANARPFVDQYLLEGLLGAGSNEQET